MPALGQFFPAFFQLIGHLSIAQVNLPVGVLIWVMIITMLVKVDFGALGEVRRHGRGIAVTLIVNWPVKRRGGRCLDRSAGDATRGACRQQIARLV